MTRDKQAETTDAAVSTQNRGWYQRQGMPIVIGILMLAGAVAFWQYMHPPAKSARIAMATGDFERAAMFYQKAANQGDKMASTSLGNLYYLGLGVDRDYQQAGELYFDAASSGVAEAQMNLGHLFKQGLGVNADPMRAFAWYNMANIHGNLAAEYYLRQITQEWTLSPLQINTAMTKWAKLSALVAEGL